MKRYQITIISATGRVSYTGLFASSIAATVDAVDRAPAGARICAKAITSTTA